MVTTSDGININAERVFRDIGYCADCEPSVRMLSLVNEYVENARDLIDPSYACIIRNIKSVNGSRIVIEGSITFKSEVIARLLEQCEKAALFLVTIGKYLEETTYRLAKDGLILQSAVLDAIGSDAAEAVADFIQNLIGETARARGLHISQRFSPGYCDWDVNQQKMIFRAMEGNSAGIRLTEGCLMLPRKSISGIIGIGPAEVKDYNPCTTCDKLDCVGRREGHKA